MTPILVLSKRAMRTSDRLVDRRGLPLDEADAIAVRLNRQCSDWLAWREPGAAKAGLLCRTRESARHLIGR